MNNRTPRQLMYPYLVVAGGLFVLPLSALLFNSLRIYDSGIPSGGVGVGNYVSLLSDRNFWSALVSSLTLASTGSGLAVLFAVALALGTDLLDNSILRTMVIVSSAIVFFSGLIPKLVALQFLMSDNGVWGALTRATGIGGLSLLYHDSGTVLAYMAMTIPVLFTILYVSRRAVPVEQVNAALDLGASISATHFRIIIPMMRRGILVAFILGFALIIGDALVVDIIGGGRLFTVGLYILDLAKVNDWGRASAAAVVVLTAVGSLLAGLASFLSLVWRA